MCAGLDAAGILYQYEPFAIPYIPKKTRKYTPDILLPNGIILELKGRFETADRTKHLAVKEDHPDLDIRFVFSNPNARISKTSKTTYAMWCESKGYKYCKADAFRRSWLTEPANEKVLAAVRKLQEKK